MKNQVEVEVRINPDVSRYISKGDVSVDLPEFMNMVMKVLDLERDVKNQSVIIDELSNTIIKTNQKFGKLISMLIYRHNYYFNENTDPDTLQITLTRKSYYDDEFAAMRKQYDLTDAEIDMGMKAYADQLTETARRERAEDEKQAQLEKEKLNNEPESTN